MFLKKEYRYSDLDEGLNFSNKMWRGDRKFIGNKMMRGLNAIMSEKEELLYLINGLLEGTYTIKTFCSEFTRIYDLEIDYDVLTDEEYKEFGDLCTMAGRFSDDSEELKIPNMYFSESEIICRAKAIKKKLNKSFGS